MGFGPCGAAASPFCSDRTIFMNYEESSVRNVSGFNQTKKKSFAGASDIESCGSVSAVIIGIAVGFQAGKSGSV